MNTNEILTERLRLHPPMLEDAASIFVRYAQDADVCRYVCWRPHRSIDDTVAILRQLVEGNDQGTRVAYLIRARGTDELLGSVGGVVEGTKVQFGYVLARDAWGQGYATEAARAFVARAIELPGIWQIQAFCDVENKASARVLAKAGLSLEGTLRRYMIFPNLGDEPRDVLFYAKVRDAL
jgi:RimJ/RimL family protein N-acetyltransferase